MKFGVFYVLEAPDGDYKKAWHRMLGQIEYAEELGYESVWLAEHHGSNYGSMPRLPIALSAIAQRTTTMRLGTAVTILPFSNPIRIAEDFAQVDLISNGRLEFGVGRAYQPLEYKAMGMPEKQPYSREIFNEALEIVHGLWNNERFSYEGKHFTVDDVECVPKPLQSPVPTYVAASSPETFTMCAEKDLSILTAATLSPSEDLKPLIHQAKEIYARQGHALETINFPLLWITHVAPTLQEGKDRAASALTWYFDRLLSLVPQGEDAPQGYGPFAAAAKAYKEAGGFPVEDLNEAGNLMLGDPEFVIDRIADMRDSLGLQEIITWQQVGGMDDKYVRDSMRIFAEEVMPEFKGKPPVVPETLRQSTGQ
ncbi:LLM class flavin-dependent oxidoreductase (plasmid) [Rhodococcus opacus]|uniref:LLM class flavin-dependent oxidoreductase n=1 Tax=Rhodococcus opacus TaxID=37919 RepID=UPI0034D1748E